MKKYFSRFSACLLLFLSSTSLIQSQEQKSLFEELLGMSRKQSIRAELLEKVLGMDGPISDMQLQHEQYFRQSIMRTSDDYTLVVIRMECGAGGVCESETLYSFDKSGKKISRIPYEASHGDCSFDHNRRVRYFNGEVIQIIESRVEFDCDRDSVIQAQHESYEYNIFEDGRIEETHQLKIDSRRKFREASIKKLEEVYLAERSKEELATMRNELFASYGYRFKSAKWQQYFGSKDWYKATRDVVTKTDLTPIEYYNLQLIQRLEQRKN